MKPRDIQPGMEMQTQGAEGFKDYAKVLKTAMVGPNVWAITCVGYAFPFSVYDSRDVEVMDEDGSIY